MFTKKSSLDKCIRQLFVQMWIYLDIMDFRANKNAFLFSSHQLLQATFFSRLHHDYSTKTLHKLSQEYSCSYLYSLWVTDVGYFLIPTPGVPKVVMFCLLQVTTVLWYFLLPNPGVSKVVILSFLQLTTLFRTS